MLYIHSADVTNGRWCDLGFTLKTNQLKAKQLKVPLGTFLPIFDQLRKREYTEL
ncbi:MAG: hypothetical protein HAW66_05210 [Shewanella sp.]|nr:hypothetical protein [Shewanella sp.]